jgi:hypothetical protein
MPLITYREALKAALAEELERDENVFVLGEEVAQYNSRMRAECQPEPYQCALDSRIHPRGPR